MRKLEDGNIRRKREVSGQNRRVGISAVENWGKKIKRLSSSKTFASRTVSATSLPGFSHAPKRRVGENTGNEVVAGGYWMRH